MYFSFTELHWTFIIVANILLLAVFLVNLVIFYVSKEHWFARKLSHIIVHIVVAVTPYFLENIFDLFLALAIFILILLCASAIPKIQFLQRIIDASTRIGEDKVELLVNGISTAITILVLVIVFQNNLYIYTAAVLSLSLGDGLGEMIGRPFGKMQFKVFSEKSVEGSIAVFVGIVISLVTAFLVYGVFAWPDWWKILIIAFIGTIVEVLNYKFVDNIALPTIVAIMVMLFFETFTQ